MFTALTIAGITLIAVGGLAASVALSLGSPTLSEIRDFVCIRLAARRFFRRHLVRMRCGGGAEVLLVGTLHAVHLEHPSLSLSVLEDTLLNYGPDRVGIEARPRDLKRSLIGLSPIDMVALEEMAARRHIPLFGFDAWSEEEFETAAASGETPDYNSPARNDQMAALLAAELGSEKTLVFTGYSHVRPLAARLVQQGFESAPLTTNETEALLRPAGGKNRLAPALAPALARAASELDQYLRTHPGRSEWSDRVQTKRDLLRRLERSFASARAGDHDGD